MTADEFRKLALAQPDAEERGHLGHPDFRVRGKIFATLGYPNAECAMVKLAPGEQLALVAALPDTFAPAKGKWGERGATIVRLETANAGHVRKALASACALVPVAPAMSKTNATRSNAKIADAPAKSATGRPKSRS
jgi:hypothetical protein